MNKNVLIADVGPVGLAMAADLVRVSVRLVEKAPERTDKSKKGAHAALSSAAWHEIRIGMTKANRRSISRARESYGSHCRSCHGGSRDLCLRARLLSRFQKWSQACVLYRRRRPGEYLL